MSPVTLPGEVSIHCQRRPQRLWLRRWQAERVLVKDVHSIIWAAKVIQSISPDVSFDERGTVTSARAQRRAKGAEDGGVLHSVPANLEVECLVREITDAVVTTFGHARSTMSCHIKDSSSPRVKARQDGEWIVGHREGRA